MLASVAGHLELRRLKVPILVYAGTRDKQRPSVRGQGILLMAMRGEVMRMSFRPVRVRRRLGRP
jgi:hypothetical protein